MKCKYCQAEMPEDARFCPYCGESRVEEPTFDTAAEAERVLQEEGEAVIIVSDEEPAEEMDSQVEEAVASPQVKKMKRMALMSGCLAALALLGTVLFFAVRGGFDFGSLFKWMKPRQDTLLGNESYSVSDKKAWSKREDVVATMGDVELTNGQLQVYYWLEVMDFLNNYSYYLSYLGMDYTQPLDEQKSIEQDGSTWQQYFLKNALDTWRTNQALANLARENGFQLDAESRESLDKLPASMEATAKEKGFESADALLQEEMGPGCTLADYMSYMETYYLSHMYFGELYDALEPSDAEIEKYFNDNADTFKEEQITKESGKYYTVQHLLVKLEGGTKGEDGKLTYSEAEWKACQEKAQKLLDEWKTGKATEESFTELVEKNTTGQTSLLYGGTLSRFVKGDMKKELGEAFDTWCTAEERKAGDVELVKSDYGYHLVYFVESQDIWYAEARDGLLSQLSGAVMKETLEKNPTEVNYKKIVLGVVELG